MKTKRVASATRIAVALAGVIVVIAGCHKVTGGGWIAGVNGGKATFGFQAQCKTEESTPGETDFLFYEGQFQYQDPGANVRFHGDVNTNQSFLGFGALASSCEELVDLGAQYGATINEAEFTGECVSRPGGAKGTFKVTVVDRGKPGPDAGDEISVATPNYISFPIFDEEWNQIGEEILPIGAPCTEDGQAYSNSGLLGGGNIVMPGHKDAGSGAKKKG